MLSAAQLLTATPDELREHIVALEGQVEDVRRNALDAYERLCAIHAWEMLDGNHKLAAAKRELQALLVKTEQMRTVSLLDYRRRSDETP